MEKSKYSDTIALRLKLLRQLFGLTQKELSEKSGISVSTISKYENGIPVPKINVMLRLARSYGVSVDFLAGETDCPFIPGETLH